MVDRVESTVASVPVKGPSEWEMQVVWMDPDDLVPNSENPNQQDDRTFNALCDSIRTEGWTQPVTAVFDAARGKHEIVGGEHRWRAARVLGSKVPVLALPHDEFDRDRRDWNVVKDNLLRGSLNPEKFTRLYQRMAQKYDADTLKTLMGFTSEDAFQRVFKDVARQLPAELQQALLDSREEIRTIDDLSAVLNRLFRDHGETLDSNYMVLSWGSKEVLWIRADSQLWKAANALIEQGRERGESADQVMLLAVKMGLQEIMPIEV